MKPRVKIATARTPDGGRILLYQHDRDFLIELDGEDLMLSRHHESELELARLGCAHLAGRKAPCILIGGLGMGYTLRQALDMLGPGAEVVVGELLHAVVEWNRDFLGELNGQPLADERVDLETGNIVKLISHSKSRFDAILLDVDNGPSAMTYSGNRHSGPSKAYEQLLVHCGFHVRRYRVPAYKGSKSQSRFIWVASEDKSILPPGGGEPRRPQRKDAKAGRRRK
jgi:spermidine synthase